ncbi:phosphorylated adapter RNA export-like protein, partial [Perilla frutescens var. hirtella]
MEGQESLFDTLFDEDNFVDGQDVEMLDVEEAPNVTNINRFVLDACKRLRERKSYLMYTAVGCLGAAALSDLIKE